MKKIIEEIKRLNIETIKEDESLSKYTTFKIGGPARVLVEAKSDEDVLKLVSLFDEMKEDYLITVSYTHLTLPTICSV